LRARRPRPMRIRVLAVLILAGAATVTLSLIRGQERSPRPAPAPVMPAPAALRAAKTAPVEAHPVRDLSALNELQSQMLLTAQRAAAWMYRMPGVKGRFLHGYLPALKQEMEGDHYLRQVGAAFALARAARFTGEARFAARATQAVLALLDDTTVDPAD